MIEALRGLGLDEARCTVARHRRLQGRRWSGRWSRSACAALPRPATRFSSSRKSTPSSRTRFPRSSITSLRTLRPRAHRKTRRAMPDPLLREVGELDPGPAAARDSQPVARPHRGRCAARPLRHASRNIADRHPHHQLRREGFAASAELLRRLPAQHLHRHPRRLDRRARALAATSWPPACRNGTRRAATQMGGEGAQWIGQAPFTGTPHIFQNLGDGTYFHSGLLAVRACHRREACNITYKILLNGADRHDRRTDRRRRNSSPATSPRPHVAHQLTAEGCKRVALVTDDVSTATIPRGLSGPSSRSTRARISTPCSANCATIRRRQRDHLRTGLCDRDAAACASAASCPIPNERLFIHPEVCEGCGDCGVQSNCIAVEPLETVLGRKRRINQTVCNKDFSCAKGLCPSFITSPGWPAFAPATARRRTQPILWPASRR